MFVGLCDRAIRYGPRHRPFVHRNRPTPTQPNPNHSQQRVHDVVDASFVVQTSHVPYRWLGEVGLMSNDDEFEQFFLAQYDAVLQLLVLTTGDRERATDATQEAFIKAYARWSKIKHYESPAAWVRRVAINASHDSFRSDRRRRKREEAVPVDVEASDRYSSDTRATELLRELPTRQREVATLFYVDDRTVAEIASILRLNEGTVKYHLSHARDGLRRLLDEGGGDS